MPVSALSTKAHFFIITHRICLVCCFPIPLVLNPFDTKWHVRAGSVIKKSAVVPTEYDPAQLHHVREMELIKRMAEYPLVIERAAMHRAPHMVADYIYTLATAFNRFYADCPINSEEIDASLRDARLVLTDKFRMVMLNALDILNIKTPEIM